MERRALMRTAATIGITISIGGCLDDIDSLGQDTEDTEMPETSTVQDKIYDFEFHKEDIDLSSPKAVVRSFLDLNVALYHEEVTSDEFVEMLREMCWERSPVYRGLERSPRFEWYDSEETADELSVVEEDLSVDDIEDVFLPIYDIEEDLIELAANTDNAFVEGEREDDNSLKLLTVQPDGEWLLFR